MKNKHKNKTIGQKFIIVFIIIATILMIITMNFVRINIINQITHSVNNIKNIAFINIVMILFSFFSIVGLLIYSYYAIDKNKVMIETKRTYQLLINEMQQGLALHEIVLDDNNNPIDYIFLGINPAYEKIIGFKEKEVVGRSVLELMPNTEKYWIEEYGKVSLHDTHLKYENYSVELDKYFEVLAYSPKRGQFATIVTDITQRKLIEKNLNKEKVLLETTLISVGDGVISTNKNGEIILINDVAEILTGWQQEQASGRELAEVFQVVDEEIREQFKMNMEKVFQNNETYKFTEQIILHAKNGIDRPIEGIITPIKDNDGVNNGTVLVFRDYTDKKIIQEEIKHLSFHDKLTGLYNRRFFDEELKRIDTKRNYPITIVMADLNGLKLINDAFGHFEGDKLLIKFCGIIKKESRADDIISRIGGDEFVFLLPKTEEEKAYQIIERIKEGLSKEKVCEINISASFGCYSKINESMNIEHVFKKAEEQMYKHKLNESTEVKKKAIDIILNTLYQKHEKEKEHSLNVSRLCDLFGRALNFNEGEIRELRLFGRLHNIGKINLDKNILSQQRSLEKDESIEIKKHAEIGYQILRSTTDYSKIADYVLEHHERYDGSGYPRGLQKEEISVQARMLAIIEAYDRMTATNYKKLMHKEDAIEQLIKHKGKQFDPHLVDIFINQVI